MPRLLLSVGLFLSLSLSVHAQQDRPKIEVFGGFSYANINAHENRINTKGWHAAIAVNSGQSWLDFAADVSGHYGSFGGDSTATYVAMAGPRFAFSHGRVTVFVHSLYGISFGHPSSIPPVEFETPQRVWFTFVPGGGGLDIALARRLALRVIQVDLIFPSPTPYYLPTLQEANYANIQVRFSAGIALRFGRV